MKNSLASPIPMPRQSGFLLLESLIALILFALGILGLVGMQATAAKVAADAQYRAEASLFADDIISQMRASGNRFIEAEGIDDAKSVEENFKTGGAKYTNWLAKVNDPQTGIPGAVETPPAVEFTAAEVVTDTATGSKSKTLPVTITISWKGPGESVAHKLVTLTTLDFSE